MLSSNLPIETQKNEPINKTLNKRENLWWLEEGNGF
jgi:hypothetical protein